MVRQKFGDGLRTSGTTNELLQYALICHMDCSVADTGRVDHFVPPKKTQAWITEKTTNFDRLKAELPERGNNPYMVAETKQDKKAEYDAGGSIFFNGQKLRNIVVCRQYKKPRGIYITYALNSSKLQLSKQEQATKKNEIYVFKEEGFICGDTCLVKGYDTKRSMRCGCFVETQSYILGGVKKDNKEGRGSRSVNPDICYLCCNMENLVSSDDIKNKFNVGGKVPLTFCNFCYSLNIDPPATSTATNFVGKRVQE